MQRGNTIWSSVLLALACVCMPVYAIPGASCDDPIVLTADYSEQIWEAKEVWYIANTFDLPLAMSFYPANSNAPKPELYLDFGCTPGAYEDSILCSLFCVAGGAGGITIDMPARIEPDKKTDAQGRTYYIKAMGKSYRDMLLQRGIDYNVPVYIHAIFHGGGTLSMEPDAFNNCMDGPKFMHLGDTVHVNPYDKNRHVIVPYIQWQYDSIRYVWQGTQPCIFGVSNTCVFDPTDATDASVIDGGPNKPIQPGGFLKESSEQLMRYTNPDLYPSDAGVFFAKFYSEAPGVMKVEKIPAPPPANNAILLEYNKPAQVYANDTARLYAIKSSWVKAMQFLTPTKRVFRMYIGTAPDFYTKDAIATYQFDRTDDGHQLNLFAEGMAALWANKPAGQNYLYVRFECSGNTTVLPALWTPSDCMANFKQRVVPGKQFEVQRDGYGAVICGLYYEDWKNGQMEIAWKCNSSSSCYVIIADSCNVPSSNKQPAFVYKKIERNKSVTYSQETVNSWAQYVDPDGYLYIRFVASAKGNITMTTTADPETDPACIPYDSVLTVTAWDSCIWRGTKYTESGSYQKEGSTDPETECVDSLFTLNLTVHTTMHDTYTADECDSVVFHNITYTMSGEYSDTIGVEGGNRLITALHLTVRHRSEGEEHQEVCDAFEWHDKTYTESGVYKDTLLNAAGCDSVVTLHLTVHPSYHLNLPDVTECNSFVWGDTIIRTTGEYTRSYQTAYGCDSIVTRNITINQSSPLTVEEVTAYDSYTWNGMTFTRSYPNGGPSMEFENAAGCDSLVMLKLIIKHLTEQTVEQTICASELPYVWRGVTCEQEGTYVTDTFPGAEVDTVYTLVLAVNPVYAVDTVAEACDRFEWRGTTYTQSGDYPYETQTTAGCDSVITLHLTINNSAEVEPEIVKACDTYEWHGTTYTEGGVYQDRLATVLGCDSVCTLHLTLNHTSFGEQTLEKCESYTTPSGVTYTQSGTYVDTISNSTGCDSVITLYLTIIENCMQYDTVYFCRGFNKEHEEKVNDEWTRRYRTYIYQSPATWDYMEGVMLSGEANRTLMDLNRAEQNLRQHYVGELTPVEAILWSVRKDATGTYQPIVVETQPQWIEAGRLAVQIQFLCGEIYNNSIPMDVEFVQSNVHQSTKRMENGQVVIIRGGVKYSILGTRIE